MRRWEIVAMVDSLDEGKEALRKVCAIVAGNERLHGIISNLTLGPDGRYCVEVKALPEEEQLFTDEASKYMTTGPS